MKKVLLFTVIAASYMGANETVDTFFTDRDAPKRKSVERLYTKWYAGPLHRMLTRKGGSSRIAGRWANSKRSKSQIKKFIKKYNINTEEMEQPVESFQTFNQFFSRKLKPNARPLPEGDPNAIVSPADGSALAVLNIREDTLFPTKSTLFSVREILRDDALAKQFEGGTAVIVRLAPWDYHRFHFPVAGVPEIPYRIAGRYESVSPEVYAAGTQPIQVNERHLIRFRSDKASTMAIVLVGALFVGAIVETYQPGKPVQRGDEMGYFEFGASTMVLFFQKDTIQLMPTLIRNSAEGKETPVRMGQLIGHVIPEERKKA